MQSVRTPADILHTAVTVSVLCLDLDGTIRRSKSGREFISGPDDIELFPGVEETLKQYRQPEVLIVGISNQGGVAFGLKTPSDVNREIMATVNLFADDPFYEIKVCLHHEHGTVFPYNVRSLFRKPGIGMLVSLEEMAFKDGYVIDWSRSLFVGDRPEDQQCAANAGIEFKWAKDFFNRPYDQSDLEQIRNRMENDSQP